MKSLTVQQLLDICSEFDELGNDPYSSASEVRMKELCQFLRDIIGSSHMGCAADEVILDLGDSLT